MYYKFRQIIVLYSLVLFSFMSFQTSVFAAADTQGEDIVKEKRMTFAPLDPRVPITDQLGENVSPVVLINVFTVDPADVGQLLKAWEADANWMKRQPGYISTQLHKGIAGSSVFLNYAVWESVGHFRNAFSHPEFRSSLSAYPSSTIAQPHLFSKVAVPNLCTE